METVSNTFKVGFSYFAVPQFETSCRYVEATLEEFLAWNCDHSSISGPFIDYDYSKFWAYADYKYVVSLFEDKTDIFQVSQHIPLNHGNNLFLRNSLVPFSLTVIFSQKWFTVGVEYFIHSSQKDLFKKTRILGIHT